MKTYAEWCKHYDYEPASTEANTDYERYKENLKLFESLPEESQEPIEVIEEHAKTLIAGFLERGEGFTLSVRLISPEGLNLVGYGIFISSGDLTVRLRYVYKERSKALAKLDALVPARLSVSIQVD